MRHASFLLSAALLLITNISPAESTWTPWARTTPAPGNIAVSPEGRVFVSLHQFFAPSFRVVEVLSDGSTRPFPSETMAAGHAASPLGLDSVLGIRCDHENNLWMLDNGMREKSTPKLVAWNIGEFRLHQVIYFPPTVTHPDSFLNDLAVDRDNGAVYIADPAGGANAALIVVDLATGLSRRVLEGHESVTPDNAVELSIDGRAIEVKGPTGAPVRPRIGVNPIALDSSNEYLYFGPMHGTKLYRIATAPLRDASLPAAELMARVQTYAPRPISDGISIDHDGNIYISDIASNAVGVIKAEDKSYQILAQSPELSWPDAFSFGPDGLLYGVANQLHRSAPLNGGSNAATPPFLIFTMTPLSAGVVGR